MMPKLLAPIHPGEILMEDFIKPLEMTINQLARDIGVPAGRISLIVRGRRAISADTALRLGRYFRMSAETWLDLQSDYELRVVRQDHGKEIEQTVKQRVA